MSTTRRIFIGSTAFGSSALLGAFGLPSAIVAQEATPPSVPMGPPESLELAPGVIADSMTFVEGQESPSLYRLHFDPGVVYEVFPSPSLELGYLESGSLTVVLDVALALGRVGETGAAGETIDANTEFTLEAGQFLVLQPGGTGEIRNTGEQTATLSVAGLTPGNAGAPEATPAA